MTDFINICILDTKCKDCKHNRPDPERGGECSCYLNEDLKGEERNKYLLKVLAKMKEKKHLQTN